MRVKDRKGRRKIRHNRVRAKVPGTQDRPRLVVYRSLRHVYAQLVDDTASRTVASASTRSAELKGMFRHGWNKEAASHVGALIAKRAAEAGVKRVRFDRAGFSYHGCVAAVAEAARKGGLEF
jgi:large subunit ribosomal protein L18